MSKFFVEQIALCPKDPKAAMTLLLALGLNDWVSDHVTASGVVFGDSCTNEADLRFNYQVTRKPKSTPLELELLTYTSGGNWMYASQPRVSHLGMHCTEEELLEWKAKFELLGIGIAQEVFTDAHTNAHLLKLGRKYHYTIFDTYDILGVDLKFIVRIDAAQE